MSVLKSGKEISLYSFNMSKLASYQVITPKLPSYITAKCVTIFSVASRSFFLYHFSSIKNHSTYLKKNLLKKIKWTISTIIRYFLCEHLKINDMTPVKREAFKCILKKKT